MALRVEDQRSCKRPPQPWTHVSSQTIAFTSNHNSSFSASVLQAWVLHVIRPLFSVCEVGVSVGGTEHYCVREIIVTIQLHVGDASTPRHVFLLFIIFIIIIFFGLVVVFFCFSVGFFFGVCFSPLFFGPRTSVFRALPCVGVIPCLNPGWCSSL